MILIEQNKRKRCRALIFLCIIFTLATLICALSTRVVVRKGKKYYKEEQISLYILTYEGELPANFITKTQASKKYSDLSREKAWYKVISEGYNIGGGPHDYYNSKPGYDSKISDYTSSTDLRECDVYVVSNAKIARGESRGTHRLVYTSDGTEVYYTTDHYKTFSRRTPWNINLVSNICWIVFGVIVLFEIIYLFIARFFGKNERLCEVKEAVGDFVVFIFALIILPFYLIYLLIKKIVSIAKA